jgi:hypothetical protein
MRLTFITGFLTYNSYSVIVHGRTKVLNNVKLNVLKISCADKD